MTEQIKFELGGRYRNRLGWYKVLGFRKNELIVRYEKDGRKDNLDIELQIRITKNMNWEEARVSTNQN
jgi:hypothetical protein